MVYCFRQKGRYPMLSDRRSLQVWYLVFAEGLTRLKHTLEAISYFLQQTKGEMGMLFNSVTIGVHKVRVLYGRPLLPFVKRCRE